MVDAVCFDLDGTLFDDRQYVRAGLRHAGAHLETRAGVDLSDELIDAYFERGITEGTFDTVLDEQGLSQEHVSELVDAYHANEGDLEPFDGVERVLEELTAAYDLGLITGGRNGRDKLRRLGFEEYFDAVLVTSGRSYSKRDPDPFESILDELGAEPTAAAYVGDRPDLDFPQPNRLGMLTIRVETGRYATAEATGDATPDESVPSLEAVPAVLSRDDRERAGNAQ